MGSWHTCRARWGAPSGQCGQRANLQVGRAAMSSPGPGPRHCFPQLCGRARMEEATSSNRVAGPEQDEIEKQRRRINDSRLYRDVAPNKDPIVYSSHYNIGFMGLEKLHPFDSGKWGHIRDFLVDERVIKAESIVEPEEATNEDLLVVHPPQYLKSLKSSTTVATIIEVPPVGLLPNFVVQRQVLEPFRKQVGGTVLAGKLAKERGWAINLGGGFHHCCKEEGGGFCVYADITLCIQFAFSNLAISKVMIIDLDAHQGNGHERDFMHDERVYIVDMYNSQIYPSDQEAKKGINQQVELRSGTSTEDYLLHLNEQLRIAKDSFRRLFSPPELIMYNAGTDILDGDLLGRLRVSPAGVSRRDEAVFRFARELEVPIVMVTSGGYMKRSARVIADSIKNLVNKQLIAVQAVVL